MSLPVQGVITSVEARPREGWDDPVRGRVAWYTLFSSDITPTDSMAAGVAEIAPGDGALRLHSHAEAEIYYIIEGTGILSLQGRWRRGWLDMAPGSRRRDRIRGTT